ncbi:MAG: hypothetical protein ACT4P8_18850, partial [Betaproteobacteria bacterium]
MPADLSSLDHRTDVFSHRREHPGQHDGLARLNELSSRLWRAHSLHEGLEEMLSASLELLRADMGHVRLMDASRDVLMIAAHRGFDRKFVAA